MHPEVVYNSNNFNKIIIDQNKEIMWIYNKTHLLY